MPQLRKPHRWATQGRPLADLFQARGSDDDGRDVGSYANATNVAHMAVW
jgi:hypothetical protein